MWEPRNDLEWIQRELLQWYYRRLPEVSYPFQATDEPDVFLLQDGRGMTVKIEPPKVTLHLREK